jgi:hypothetical protein
VASKSLVEWLNMLWESWETSMWCVVCYLLFLLSLVSCGGGVRLSFIGQGESELHACRTIQLHGEVWRAVP